MSSGALLAAPSLRSRTRRWGAAAWCAIGIAATFIAISCWWVTKDQGVPGTEPGSHLFTALLYRDMLRSGDLLGPLQWNHVVYPPLTFVVGAVAMLTGGTGLVAPVVAQNLIYVPLLALGCYQTGKLVSGPRAGALAVLFALGCPLVIEQFHVFMLEAPEAALVAVAVWLLLASERFRRADVAACAGLATGLALASKQQAGLYLAGLVVVALARGGWRNWRGLAAFAAVAAVAGGPWYLEHLSRLGLFTRIAIDNAFPGTHPPLLSITNLGWYFWALLNGLLFAPLFLFAAVGTGWAIAATARRARPGADVLPELLGGAFGSWLAITATPIHVVRYTVPMVLYVSVLGTAWIARLRPAPRAGATAALGLAVTAATLGATFGVGGSWRVPLSAHPAADRSLYGVATPERITIYADRDFIVSGPRPGNILGIFRALRRAGATGISWQGDDEATFNNQGLYALARMAGLGVEPSDTKPGPSAQLVGAGVGRGPPCTHLEGGRPLWVIFGGDAAHPRTTEYCPFRTPAFSAP